MPFEEIKKKNPGNILVMSPVKDFVHNQLVRLLMKLNLEGYPIYMGHNEPVDVNRNDMITKALQEKEFDWFLWIDADVVPPDDIIERLMKSGEKIVGGIYMGMRDYLVSPVVSPFQKEDVGLMEKKDNLVTVDAMGMGCVLIHREVFEKVKKPWFEFIANEDRTRMLVSEDVNFFRKARKEGFKVWLDTTIQCEHYHMVPIFGLMPADKRPDDIKKMNERIVQASKKKGMPDTILESGGVNLS